MSIKVWWLYTVYSHVPRGGWHESVFGQQWKDMLHQVFALDHEQPALEKQRGEAGVQVISQVFDATEAAVAHSLVTLAEPVTFDITHVLDQPHAANPLYKTCRGNR